MTDSSNKFKELFCEEADDQLKVLSRELLLIENDPKNIERYATLMHSPDCTHCTSRCQVVGK